jgi:hypothetical protein
VSEVESLLRSGVDVDLQNERGQTALHIAARRAQVETAALLMQCGASHEVEDTRGRQPLSRANVDARRERDEADMKRYDEEEHWWAEDRAYVTNNAFKHSPSLAAFCARPEIGELSDRYYGRASFFTRAVGMRYLPSSTRENDMFGWHHDLEDRRLKAMILLTDVGGNDQRMSYVKGSHALFHPYAMFFRNESSLAYCREHLGVAEVFEGTGEAGDVFFFDSNGTHRGNRRPDARIRDAFFFELGIDTSNVWGGDIPLLGSVGKETEGPDPFAVMRRTEKKWERPITRRFPTWIENLFEIEAWRTPVSRHSEIAPAESFGQATSTERSKPNK